MQSIQRKPPALQKTKSDRLALIRKNLEQQNLSKEAQEIIMTSWRTGTTKQYHT